MTDSASPTDGLRAETVVMIVAGVLALAALWYVIAQRQQVLRSSPAGLDGLQVWLSSEGESAQSFTGGWLIDPETVGLMVIPLYDTALDRDRVLPRTKDDLLLQQDEYDLESDTIADKASRVPSMIVLPKWRSGMRLTGLGHPILLSEPRGAERTLRDLTGEARPRLRLSRTPFTEFTYETVAGGRLEAQIYAAQMLQAPGCDPLIGERGLMLVAECPLDGSDGRVLVVSDPDLLNNHGLRLGDNARIARDLLTARAGGGTIMIDYSSDNWLRDEADTGVVRERTWADLLRFFDPPFLYLWLGAGVALALALWRSAMRYGPVRADAMGPGAGKSLAIAARARLMRLADQDGALLGEYAKARIGAVAGQIFGPAHARHYAREDSFLGYVERRHPRHAPALANVLDSIHALPARTPAAQAISHVDELERVLEQIGHDT